MGLAERLQLAWWAPRGSALALLLSPLSALFGLLIALRRALYRLGARQVVRMPVPVVVVGNLVVGGAGKTPTVIALVRALRSWGLHPGVISRGYGRTHDAVQPVLAGSRPEEVGDEPLLIHLRTAAPVMVGRDRAAAASALRAAHPEVDVIVSDDGLQHLRLARDVQLVLFDERGAGNGRLLPAGPLREPLPARLPPATHVLYNATAASTPLPGHLLQRSLAGAVPLSDWWRGQAARLSALEALRGKPVVACAGMANPERFFRMLRDQGLEPTCIALPDHDAYQRLPWPQQAEDVLVTEKDAVKLAPSRVGRTRVWVVALDLRLPDALLAELRPALQPRATPP